MGFAGILEVERTQIIMFGCKLGIKILKTTTFEYKMLRTLPNPLRAIYATIFLLIDVFV